MNMKRTLLLAASLLLLAGTASAQDWKDALKKAATAAADKITDGKLTQYALAGTWNYTGPGVKFEGGDLASELGGEVLQIHSNHPIEAIIDTCVKQKISTVCICKPKFTLLSLLYTALSLKRLINRLSHMNIDLIILS